MKSLLSNNLEINVKKFREKLNLGKSFDVLERVIQIHDDKYYLYFLDGFVKDVNLEYVRRDIYMLSEKDYKSIHSAKDMMEIALASIEASTDDNIDNIITAILSGQTAMLGPNWNEVLVLDYRTYPARGVDEPDKEKVLRGSHDGFVETIVFNTALIRRRIRDPKLTFEMMNLGSVTKTDIAIGYLDGTVKKDTLEKVKKMMKDVAVKSLALGDQSLVEVLNSQSSLNPFPKVRFTERPDVAAAQLIEGSVIILVDNMPTALILPSNVFDFIQSVDDYYLPVFTGNYMKMVRTLVLMANLFLTPIYILIIDNPSWVSGGALAFLLPKELNTIPIFIQFLIAEMAIDGLQLASINTPNALGTSLSIIGGLILGDYAVQTGWFIPQSIFYMAIVALSSFVQPSIELSFALKFIRMILIILTGIFGKWGFVAGVIINCTIVATTKTLTGERYLYPLIPFNGKALIHLLFRTKKLQLDKKDKG